MTDEREEGAMDRIPPDKIEGSETLVVVDGKVYDVGASPLWAGGKHMNMHRAGRDLSAEIKAAPHGPEVLERMKLVGEPGTVAEAAAGGQAASPARARRKAPQAGPLVKAILSKHPHPVSVHFPIALSIAGAVFCALGAAIGNDCLALAAFACLAFGAAASPAAIGAGLLSWWFNYGGTWTPIFRMKTVLSVVYVVVAAAAVAVRVLEPSSATAWTPAWWAFAVLATILPAVAMGLGMLGGKITFPS